MNLLKVAIITPYYVENNDILIRCTECVRLQTYAHITHYLVSDGVPSEYLRTLTGIRHIELSIPHRDNGNTPRAIGGICALNEGADIIMYLDADNLYLQNHVEIVVERFRKTTCLAIFSLRNIFLKDDLNNCINDPEDSLKNHVDTSCISLSRNAGFLLPMWAMIPKELSPFCDRVFYSFIKRYIPHKYEWTDSVTVLYEGKYSNYYKLFGRSVPDEINDVDFYDIKSKYDSKYSISKLGFEYKIDFDVNHKYF